MTGPPEIDRVADLFRGLSDPNRLRILQLLLDGEKTEKVIVARLMAPQPRIARHLAYLKERGLVLMRKDGRYSVCSLNRAGAEIRTLFQMVEQLSGQLAA